MRKYDIDDILMGILSIVLPIVILLSCMYGASHKNRESVIETSGSGPALEDKFILCATRIYNLEKEVKDLQDRLYELETDKEE